MKKIYLDNPYKKTLVTSPIPLEGEKNIFLPKETIFLKETPHYKGEISRINGEKREDGNLKVQLANHKESITLSLSWEERLQFLQDSMARVLLSISIKHLLQEDTVDYYLDKKSWIELETSDLSFRDMDRIEDLTNYLLQGNFPFYSDSYDEEDKTMIYIGEYEGVPHYGPHLQYTGEVSLIKITSLEKIKDRIRIFFVSGMEAFHHFREDEKLLQSLRLHYDVKENKDILKAARRIKTTKDSLAKDNKKMQEELGLEAMNEYLKMATTVKGRHYIYKVLDGVNFRELKYISGKIMDRPDYVQIYGIPNGSMSQILVCISKNILGNVKNIYDELKEIYPLTGGGNLYRIQANCPITSLSDVMDEFLVRLQKF